MTSIRWINKRINELKCPLCHKKMIYRMLEARKYPIDDLYVLSRCQNCDICFFDNFFSSGARAVDQYSEDMMGIDFSMYMLETGTGLDFFSEVIDRIPSTKMESVLEIGCGIGLALDYCQFKGATSTCGLEPSEYGRFGSENLGLKIKGQSLQTFNGDESFSLVLSFEVIEHVLNPIDFLSLISSRITSDGLLVLTTPNSNYIDRKKFNEEITPLLFLGEHKILFNPTSLSNFLYAAGFKFLDFSHSTESQLVVYASKQQFSLDVGGDKLMDDYLTVRGSTRYENSEVAKVFLRRQFISHVLNERKNVQEKMFGDVVGDIDGDESLGLGMAYYSIAVAAYENPQWNINHNVYLKKSIKLLREESQYSDVFFFGSSLLYVSSLIKNIFLSKPDVSFSEAMLDIDFNIICRDLSSLQVERYVRELKLHCGGVWPIIRWARKGRFTLLKFMLFKFLKRKVGVDFF